MKLSFVFALRPLFPGGCPIISVALLFRQVFRLEFPAFCPHSDTTLSALQLDPAGESTFQELRHAGENYLG